MSDEPIMIRREVTEYFLDPSTQRITRKTSATSLSHPSATEQTVNAMYTESSTVTPLFVELP